MIPQNSHLLDRYLIEFYQSFALRHTLVNKNGIEIFLRKEKMQRIY